MRYQCNESLKLCNVICDKTLQKARTPAPSRPPVSLKDTKSHRMFQKYHDACFFKFGTIWIKIGMRSMLMTVVLPET